MMLVQRVVVANRVLVVANRVLVVANRVLVVVANRSRAHSRHT